MAKILDKLPSKKSGPSSKYPWDEWLDGQARELRRGEDFDCKCRNLAVYANRIARERQLKLQTIRFGDDVLFLQVKG